MVLSKWRPEPLPLPVPEKRTSTLGTIYCQIRKQHVPALPEEIVRQRLIIQMTQQLGFPISCISVEKGLRQMPHIPLDKRGLPLRRADIVCFAKDIHPNSDLYPLLLIECKAVPLNAAVISQVIGYNYYLQAKFIAIANQHEMRTGWVDPEKREYQFIDGMLSYQQFMEKCLKT